MQRNCWTDTGIASAFLRELPVILLNSVNVLLKGPVEGHTLRTQYQLVKVLPLLGINCEAGIDIFVDEDVIEHNDVR
jgi:hypothetical protein